MMGGALRCSSRLIIRRCGCISLRRVQQWAGRARRGRCRAALVERRWHEAGRMAAFYNKSLITRDVVRARLEYRLWAGNGHTIQRHLSDHRLRIRLRNCQQFAGPHCSYGVREDKVTPLKWGKDFAAAVPGARLVVLSGCGQLPNLEKAHDFNQAVLGLLQGHKKQ